MTVRNPINEMVLCDTDECTLPAQERVVLHGTGTVYRKCCHHAWDTFCKRSLSGFTCTRQTLEGSFVLQWPGVPMVEYAGHHVDIFKHTAYLNHARGDKWVATSCISLSW